MHLDVTIFLLQLLLYTNVYGITIWQQKRQSQQTVKVGNKTKI